jgi:hypothetical protein
MEMFDRIVLFETNINVEETDVVLKFNERVTFILYPLFAQVASSKR